LSFHLNGFSQKNKELLIKGTDSISHLVVSHLEYKKHFASDSLLKAEVKLFGERLNKKGFINYQTVITSNNDSLCSLNISLHNKVKTIHLSHPHTASLLKDTGFKQLDSVSFAIPFNNLNDYLENLLNDYKNKGYPFAKVYLNNIRKDSVNIISDLVIIKGGFRSLDAIIIKGYEDFPTSYIKHYLKLNTNTSITENKISKLSSDFFQISFVSEIKKPEILFTKDSTALYLYLNKSKSNSFDGLIGISNAQDNKNIQMNGYLKLHILNTLNFGESLNLNWVSDGDESQSLNLKIKAPYILKSPLISAYELDIQKQDTTFLNVTNSISLEYQLKNKQKLGFTISNRESNIVTESSRSSFSDFSSLFYGLTYSYEIPNIHPVFKTKFYLKTDANKGIRNNISQNKIKNDLRILFNLSKNQNILIKNSSEILLSRNYLDNELFRLGGANSIRGFAENSLLAKSYTYSNIAYNYLINNSSYISLLSDLGVLKELHIDSLLTTYSFGVGYTTKTAIGNLGIQYFIGNTSRNPFSFTSSKLHFSISQNF